MGRPPSFSDDDLLRVARDVFTTEGPQASLARVAERLGVSTAALFKRVPTKAELLLRSLCPPQPAFLTAMAAGPGKYPRDELLTHLQALAAFVMEALPGVLALRAAGVDVLTTTAPENAPPVILRRTLAAWLAADRSGFVADAVDVDVVADLLVSLCEARAAVPAHALRPVLDFGRAIDALLGAPDHIAVVAVVCNS